MNMDRAIERFTEMQGSQSTSPVSSIAARAPPIPALLMWTSTLPNLFYRALNRKSCRASAGEAI